MRRMSLAAAATLALWPFGAAAQTDNTVSGDRLAYAAAMKCFVANGVLVSDQEQAGDKAKAAAYDAKARRSFDLAVQFGRKIGLSGQHINQDFGLAQARELPKLVQDSAYFKQAAATCKALGLM